MLWWIQVVDPRHIPVGDTIAILSAVVTTELLELTSECKLTCFASFHSYWCESVEVQELRGNGAWSCLLSMQCYQELLFLKGEELEIRSTVFDGYLAWIASVAVRTLSILFVEKEKQKTVTCYLRLHRFFFFLALARLDLTRLFSAMKTLVIING